MNQVIDNIKNRRSIRKFVDKKIPEETIKELAEAGRFAPSSHNSQPWRLIVVTDKKTIKECSEILKQWFKGLIRLGKLASFFSKKIKNEIESAKNRAFSEEDLFFYNAPLLIFICSKKGRFHVKDCACAAQNMMLAARSLGIGSCWIGFADLCLNRKKGFLKKIEVPEGHEIMASLVFGYADKFPKNALPRKEGAGIVKWVK